MSLLQEIKLEQLKVPSTLTSHGYEIKIKKLSTKQLLKIKDDLLVRPFTAMSIGEQITFKAYRIIYNKYDQPIYTTDGKICIHEGTPLKIVMPLYYGIANYGIPETITLSNGDDILPTLLFKGGLRQEQQEIVDIYMSSCSKVQGWGGGLVELPCGGGKTVIGINIISQLRKKTLIIVHKEFLMNQWIERIQQFLPDARIGRIQGQIIDIVDKDIVIGMLQSLSMKEYATGTFASFGLTIVDEVHHISSNVFSNALFNIVSRYTLGLSATMNRKDGTTHIFKKFLGDIICRRERSDKFDVVVRAIHYRAPESDTEFHNVPTDFRGNPKYSTMISKLCEYWPRTDFILQILTDMRIENPYQQIMIIAHNKSVLTCMYNTIVHRNIGTVGYYIGGMKEAALKLTESKEIIIATYSMAAEALDIKTLTTLIMVTPKTDIEQCVGRILREKHSKPIIIDIIDSHGLFQNQWQKRRQFYKKQKYCVIQCNAGNYLPFHISSTNITNWNIINNGRINTDNIDNTDNTDNNADNNADNKKKNLLDGKCFMSIK